MDVLDHQQHRSARGEAGKDSIHRLKQLLAATSHDRGAAGQRPQRRQRPPQRIAETVERLPILDHAPQSRNDRCERQLPLGELDAFTEQNQRVQPTSTRLELRNQPALPDPRLSGHQQRPAAPRRGASEQPLQRLQLSRAADKPR